MRKMGKIALLSKTLQNQIAAGEVVERPASIAKELLENSLDAGARNISLEIEGGGIQKIRIIDDGDGMDESDLLLSFQRYATSKIKSVDDLFAIDSFGFRGEAIASIASVSAMTIRTKKEHNDLGLESVNGKEPTPCACPKGTEILVENVFWNVPARKKFLKSENTESREIIKLVEAFALVHPEISLTLKKDHKEVFSFPSEISKNREENQKKRCEKVLGKSIAQAFLPLSFLGTDIQISGFCTHPNFHHSNRNKQFIFVNGRIIESDKSVYGAVSQSYYTLMPKGKFPAFVLFLQINPDKVDVNVHPRKTEVRFNNPSEIFQIIKGTFLNALSQKNSEISPNTSPQSANFFQKKNFEDYNFSPSPSKISENFSSPKSFSAPTQQTHFGNFSLPPAGENCCAHHQAEISENTIVGQARNSFIIREEKDGIRVIDQHAAHERVRYEQLLRDFRSKKVISQPLLTPAIFSVSASEKSLLMAEAKVLSDLGFEIEDFGGQEISVSAVPSGNTRIDIEKLFHNILSDLDSFDPRFGEHISSFAEKTLSYTACRGAKKFGDPLSQIEMEALVSDWEKCTHPEACAHGRPVSTFFPYKTLENECGRY